MHGTALYTLLRLAPLISIKYTKASGVIACPPYSKIFSKTIGPFEAKFNVELPCVGGMNKTSPSD